MFTRRTSYGVAAGVLFLIALCGCQSIPNKPPTIWKEAAPTERIRTLLPFPAYDQRYARTDQALLATFCAFSKMPLAPGEMDTLLPAYSPVWSVKRAPLRAAAKAHGLMLVTVKLTPEFLWEQLGKGHAFLIKMPMENFRHLPTFGIPVAWNLDTGEIACLSETGDIETIDDSYFFAGREPWGQAALCIIRPGKFTWQPTREQRLLLADFWLESGKFSKADHEYAEVQKLQLDGLDASALIGQGNANAKLGKYGNAIQYFEAALKLEPDNPRILNNLADTMLHGNQGLLVALQFANQAARLAPQNPFVLETLGSINLRLGDAALAARQLETAWGYSLGHPIHIQASIMDQLVRAWLAQERYDIATEVLTTRMRQAPHIKVPKDLRNALPGVR